jgi:hypothetical protein
MFEPSSTLATIEAHAFWACQSLSQFFIPASMTAIDGWSFHGSGIRSIAIEDGSVSFRVVNELLVDFEFRSLVLVIGSPESIQIPSSIEELRPYCCSAKPRLKIVEFESDLNLRSIGAFAFAVCQSLESICIPSPVEFLRESCFECCVSLRTVTFGVESKLRVIEKAAFGWCFEVEFLCVPAWVEIIRQQSGTCVLRLCHRSLPS